jgi:CheY-like chemotaxis protein
VIDNVEDNFIFNIIYNIKRRYMNMNETNNKAEKEKITSEEIRQENKSPISSGKKQVSTSSEDVEQKQSDDSSTKKPAFTESNGVPSNKDKEKNEVNKTNKVVMIVDDEIDVRDTIKMVLEKAGYEVLAASSGDECLKMLENGKKPDLILMDIMMPGTPVKDVVSKIKEIKIMYFSSVRMSDEEKKNLEQTENVVGFIQKPFDINKFIEKVKSVIE